MKDKTQLLRVREIEQIDAWVRRYRLEAADPQKGLASFLPGQYLNIFYEIEGSTTSRPYSIASSPRDAQQGYYDLFIHGGGSFTSPWLFSHVKEGDTLECSYPEGRFCYDPSRDTKRLVCISGGMSVTPLRSFARAVADGSMDADLTVFCGWDYGKEALFTDEFRQYAQQCPRFRVFFAAAKENYPGMLHGYVDRKMLESHAELKDATFFLCGPEEMYGFLAEELAPYRIPAQRWHREVPGEIKTPFGQPDTPDIKDTVFSLTVQANGESLRVPARSTQTLLESLERAGLYPPARCRCANCGFCLSTLCAGEVYMPAAWETRTDQEKAENKIRLCCSFPLSDIVVRNDKITG